MYNMGNTVHRDFQRNSYLLFDLLRGNARPLGNDFHIIVRHIGISFYRQLMEGDSAPDKQKQCERENQHAVLQREVDDCPDHYCSTVFWSTSAFWMTSAPGAMPEIISC